MENKSINEKTSNIFLVHTEYHLLMTVRIVLSIFRDCHNYVYIVSGNRIQEERILNYPNIYFKRITSVDYGTSSTMREFLSLKPKNFFFFQEDNSDNIYLAYNFSRKKVNVALVQDGLKPYPKWHRRNLVLNILRETFWFYREMFKRKAVVPSLFLKSYQYGHLKYIDQLWLDYPNKLSCKTEKKIVKIEDTSKETLDEIKSIFNYKPSVRLDNMILYIGQPLKPVLWAKEIEIINAIKECNPHMQFFYKVHPNTNEEQLNNYKLIDNFSYIKDKVPAELIIASMNHSIVVSIYSTALLTNNPNCRFYWTRKLYGNRGIFTQLEIMNPTDHIVEVENIVDIK